MLIDEVTKKFQDIPKPDGVFNIQNVAEYLEKYYMAGDFINPVESICFMPPFPLTWFEFKLTNFKMGYLISVQESGKNILTEIPEEFSKIDYFIKVGVFAESSSMSLNFLGVITYAIDSYGSLVGNNKGNYYFNVDINDSLPESLQQQLDSVDIDWTKGYVLRLALNFLHCKNVKKQENQVSKKLVRANMKRHNYKRYFEKYYTLQIEPIKKILSSEGNIKVNGLQKALHICRGHFKVFDEKPMFGKVKGTFWVPAHTKGTISKGIIKKDYSLKIN